MEQPDAYTTIIEADEYLSVGLDSLYDPWFDTTEEVKVKALESATRMMMRLPWAGLPATATQRLWHPVAGETAIPERLKEACALIAVELLRGKEVEKEYLSVALSSERFARISATRDTNLSPPHLLAGIPSFEAWRLIRPYLMNELGEINLVRVD